MVDQRYLVPRMGLREANERNRNFLSIVATLGGVFEF